MSIGVWAFPGDAPVPAPAYPERAAMKKDAKKTAKKTAKKAVKKTVKKDATKGMKKVFTAKPRKSAKGPAVCNCQCKCACPFGEGESNMFDIGWSTQSGTTHGNEK
jgi:hypothetical protein